jgi:hypothetical protein
MAGDRVLLGSGQAFEGPLTLNEGQSGAAEAPIVLAATGRKPAAIDGGAGDALTLTGCRYVRVSNLRLVGCGRGKGSNGAGLRMHATTGVELDRLEVSGFRLGGVVMGADRDARLTRVRAHDNGYAGICSNAGWDGVPRSSNLVIAHCQVLNNPGDPKNLSNHSGNGIVIGGADGCLIEYCEAAYNGWDMPREGNGPVGIWGYNCDRLTIQHCISHHNQSPGEDGGGFDLDGGITNSYLQYNVSYDNQGPGILLCEFGAGRPWQNNVVRYNLSVNDGLRNYHSGIGLWLGYPGMRDCLIHNNTVINATHGISTRGDVPDMVYRNNVFLVGGDVLEGDFSHSRFERNLYWRTGVGVFHRDGDRVHSSLAEWARATGQEMADGRLVGMWADPKLLLPSARRKLPTDVRRIAGMQVGPLRPGSPCLGAGMPLAGNGGRDLYGDPLPEGRAPSLGAHEPGGASRG